MTLCVDPALPAGAEYGDGVTHFGSDPRSPDTDGDGLCDFANSTCTQDNDNSAFSRAPPKIENITISVNSSSTGVYYVQVKVSVSDPSKIYMVVITFVGLSPRIVPDPFDVGWDEGSPEMLQDASQERSAAQEELDSVLFELQPEAASIDLTKFKYGFGQPWNMVWTETVTRFANYTAVFTLTDRGKLTDGFHILVEAMDQQGNINAVETTSSIEKNFWEKSADTLKEWFNLAEGGARAYLSWMVELEGPLFGIAFGFLTEVAKNIVDMITGIPQMIDMFLHHMDEMVKAFSAIFKNVGQLFVALIEGMIKEAEEVLPTSWKSLAVVTAAALSENLSNFFRDPLHFDGTARLVYDLSYVVGRIIGFIYMNFMSGGAAIMGSIKTFLGIAKLMKVASGVLGAVPVIGAVIGRVAKGAEIAGHDLETAAFVGRTARRNAAALEHLKPFVDNPLFKKIRGKPAWEKFVNSPIFKQISELLAKLEKKVKGFDERVKRYIQRHSEKTSPSQRLSTEQELRGIDETVAEFDGPGVTFDSKGVDDPLDLYRFENGEFKGAYEFKYTDNLASVRTDELSRELLGKAERAGINPNQLHPIIRYGGPAQNVYREADILHDLGTKFGSVTIVWVG